MKSVLFIFFALIYSITVFSQNQDIILMPKFYQPIDSSAIAKDEDKKEEEKGTLMKRHDKVSYSVALGTGYSSFGSNMSMMSTYISPSINYQVNSKLNFSVSGFMMQRNFNGVESIIGNGAEYNQNASPSNYGVSATMHYQLNDKWSIWGDGAYYENQTVFDQSSSRIYNTDFKTVSVGVGYKVNDNLNFQFQFRHSDGLNPIYNSISPFYNSQFNNQSPFGYWGY